MTDYRGELFTALQRVLPQHGLSRLGAKLAESESPLIKNRLIRNFAEIYNIDMDEAESSDPEDYKTFNAFFTRALKAGVRPIDDDEKSIVCPADGTVSQIGQIEAGEVFQAKGKSFSVETLLGAEDDDSRRFMNGQFTTIYLSPQDYHRVHMPLDGELDYCRYLPGKLFSVNNTTASHIDGLFAKNERLVCLFDTPAGRCAMVLVGAMMVAGIETVWHGNYQAGHSLSAADSIQDKPVRLNKGDEMGRFKFGSTVILLFEHGAMNWEPQYVTQAVTRMGRQLGSIK